MCVVIYSYIREWKTYKNTKFYVVHNLKYSAQLDTNQTHMEVLLQLLEHVIDEWEHEIDNCI
jgi:hypothetical protein